jgi:lipoate-protein ligase A
MYFFPESLSMEFLDLSFPTPEQNLACDHALLEMCERERSGRALLRLWETPAHFVVLGYSNRVRSEVNLKACRSRGIPVLRRYSGGGTVLQGPGCLNYSLVLPIPSDGPLSSITGTSSVVLRRQSLALQGLIREPVEPRGQSDLVVGDRKCSGNAQRRLQRYLLFHGTILLDLDLSMVEECLPMPSSQPGYRGGRSHAAFMRNLHLPPGRVRQVLRNTWGAHQVADGVPHRMIETLARERYALSDWTFRL